VGDRDLIVGGRDLVRPRRGGPSSLLNAFLSAKAPSTCEAYRRDLLHFASWLEVPFERLPDWIAQITPGEANAYALDWRSSMVERSLSPATINRRLSAVRSLVSLARATGVVVWSIEIPPLRSIPLRDTRGPETKVVRRMLTLAPGDGGPRGVRNYAIMRLLLDLALRRGEVVSLDVGSLDLDTDSLQVVGKGAREAVRLTLPPQTARALEMWLEMHPSPVPHAPLFVQQHRGLDSVERIGPSAIYNLVRKLGRAASGRPARPHGLRHAAITQALERTNGDVRAVRAFSRHRKVETVLLYDDARRDMGGDIARDVAAGWDG